jgi:hypothetical protein
MVLQQQHPIFCPCIAIAFAATVAAAATVTNAADISLLPLLLLPFAVLACITCWAKELSLFAKLAASPAAWYWCCSRCCNTNHPITFDFHNV